MMSFTSMVVALVVMALLAGGYTLSLEGDVKSSELKTRLTTEFSHFTYRNDFYGAALAVASGNRLVYAAARGFIRRSDAHPGTLVPALGLSKLVTAIAVLRLVEQGRLRLDEEVFGERGLLRRLQPLGGVEPDSRLTGITVHHLLSHTAGWDEHVEPLYDPMLNEIYVQRGYNVSDIADALRTTKNNHITSSDIIRYMLTQPLHFTPGARVSHSNLGYCILGRVIEAVSGRSYASYVHDQVFLPAGMWRSRIGPSPHELQLRRKPTHDPTGNNVIKRSEDGDEVKVEQQSAYDLLRPDLLDSTLGLHSTVYDVSRLLSSLLPSGAATPLLTRSSVNTLFSRSKGQHEDSWLAMGVTVNKDGSLAYESHDPIFDVNVYMHHRPTVSATRDASQDTDPADGATVVFFGYTRKHRKHFAGKLAHRLLQHITPEADTIPDAYVDELADSHITLGQEDTLVRYRLSEHHLPAYANAARRAGYWPRWLHGYNYAGHSHYITVFERASRPAQLRFELHASVSNNRAVAFVASRVARGYQLTFLQSFISASHQQRMCHVVVVNGAESAPSKKVQFNMGAGVDEYEATLQEALATGFTPAIQSVEKVGKELYVSYIFEQAINSASGPPQAKAYHGLTLEQLEETVKQIAKSGFSLQYLDSYRLDPSTRVDNWRFSAVFTRQPDARPWVLQVDVRPRDMHAETQHWRQTGHVPRMMVAYTRKGVAQIATVWQHVGDD